MTEEKAKSLFSEGEIENLCGLAYIKAKHNAYFDNGFRAGIDVTCGKIKPEIEQLKADKEELLDLLERFVQNNMLSHAGDDMAKQTLEKHGK